MFFEIWKAEIIENAKKEAKIERERKKKQRRKEKGPARKQIQNLSKIETYAVMYISTTIFLP